MLVVKEGDTSELGAHTLQFYTAPMGTLAGGDRDV